MIEQVNKNNLPKVSIGMPVYNGEHYIREALDSLLAQTFTDFELIISDNCSMDKTRQICEEYASKDSRIRYIRQIKHMEVILNFEYVRSQAAGQYFMWAACDDRWADNCFKEMVNVLEADDKCGLVFSNFIVRNLTTSIESVHRVKASQSKNLILNYFLRVFAMCPSLIYGMYRTRLIKNMVLEKFDFSDIHFISQLTLKATIKIVDDYLYIAGTKGERKPYSLSGSKIDRMPFLRKQYDLLRQSCSFPLNVLMFSFVCLYMAYNKIRLWRY